MKEPIAAYIDHTLLKPITKSSDILELCREAVGFGFAAVCVPPFLVKEAVKALTGKTSVKTATVIGFPMGYSSVESKLAETRQAIQDGADELDIVINLIALKNGDWSYLEKEMQALTDLIHTKGKVNQSYCREWVIDRRRTEKKCCVIYGKMGIDFIKTSTGYAERGLRFQM